MRGTKKPTPLSKLEALLKSPSSNWKAYMKPGRELMNRIRMMKDVMAFAEAYHLVQAHGHSIERIGTHRVTCAESIHMWVYDPSSPSHRQRFGGSFPNTNEAKELARSLGVKL